MAHVHLRSLPTIVDRSSLALALVNLYTHTPRNLHRRPHHHGPFPRKLGFARRSAILQESSARGHLLFSLGRRPWHFGVAV